MFRNAVWHLLDKAIIFLRQIRLVPFKEQKVSMACSRFTTNMKFIAGLQNFFK